MPTVRGLSVISVCFRETSKNKKTRTTVKKPKTQKRIFDSMRAAAGGLGIPLETLQQAKEHGCPAFRGSRVWEAPFRDWMGSFPEAVKKDSSAKLRKQKLAEEIRKLRLANDLKEGKLQPVDDLCEWLGKLLGGMRATLEQRLCNELPGLVANLDAPQIRIRSKQLFDDIMRDLKPMGEKFAAEQDRKTSPVLTLKQ